jgi:Zn finger protein HypA/HybF involved in hydrogenase expression
VHEQAVLADLRRKLIELGTAEGGRRIRRVHVRVGALSHVTAAALRRAWSDTVHGTPAEGAELAVVTGTELADAAATGVLLTSIQIDEPMPGAP